MSLGVLVTENFDELGPSGSQHIQSTYLAIMVVNSTQRYLPVNVSTNLQDQVNMTMCSTPPRLYNSSDNTLPLLSTSLMTPNVICTFPMRCFVLRCLI